MKILVTGAAGFIGFNFCNYLLLTNKSFKIFGIDNMNTYYDVNLKKKRLKILKKFKKFEYFKIDINNQEKLEKLFKKKKFHFVFNFAAQAGVRYSIHHPRKYIDANILGFYNIIENSNKYKIKRLFYASSSSVYGENKNFPLKESERVNPKNIYALSKKINEDISQIFNQHYNLKSTGLRFFTVYGEWGRPDMMMMKFIECHYKKKIFYLNNFGYHTRDFTYIGDVVKILKNLLLNNKNLKDKDILNVCSNKPINLSNIISFMKKNSISPKIKKVPLQKADIIKTNGDNKKIKRYAKFTKYSDWKESIKKLITWYEENMI